MKLFGVFIFFLISIACLSVGSAAAPEQQGDIAKVLQRIPSTEPKGSLATFRIEPGFRVELAAAEPQVTDPVDIAWDKEGRLYVCELWNYPGEPKLRRWA